MPKEQAKKKYEKVFTVEGYGSGLTIRTREIPAGTKLKTGQFGSFGAAKQAAMGLLTKEINLLRATRNGVWSITREQVLKGRGYDEMQKAARAFLKAMAVMVFVIGLAGCGADGTPAPAPAPAPAASGDAPAFAPTVATATPTATPPTLVTYIFQDITICSALHSWNPTTTTIKTYPTAGNSESAYYLFLADGVKYVATPGCESGCPADVTLQRSDIHGVVCTITVTAGQLTGVTP